MSAPAAHSLSFTPYLLLSQHTVRLGAALASSWCTACTGPCLGPSPSAVMFPLVLLLVISTTSSTTARQVPRKAAAIDTHVIRLTTSYMSNAQLSEYIYEFAKRCSPIAKVHNLGDSPGGAPILSLELSDRPGVDTGKPQVKYVGNIHGDEPSGRQLLLLMAEQVCGEYQVEGSAGRELLKRVRLFLLPTVNPDGFSTRSRNNMNHVDLNRNFPDHIKSPGKDLKLATSAQQPETRIMMDYALSNRFVASLALHEGAIVANYPYDGYLDGSLSAIKARHTCPDDPAFVMMATLYSKMHTTMHKSMEFAGGITNGAEWYPLYGGSQDWHYLAAGCFEVTLELNDDKWPAPRRLRSMWQENQQALMTWPLKVVLAGIHGKVMAAGPDGALQPLQAVIRVGDSPSLVHTSPTHGTYHRILAPGKYKVFVEAEGYKTGIQEVTVPPGDQGVSQDWVLQPVVKPGGGGEVPSGLPAAVPKEAASQPGASEPGGNSGAGVPSSEAQGGEAPRQQQREGGPGQAGDGKQAGGEAAGGGADTGVVDGKIDETDNKLAGGDTPITPAVSNEAVVEVEYPVQTHSGTMLIVVCVVIPALVGSVYVMWRRYKPSYVQQGYAQVQVIAVSGGGVRTAGSRLGRTSNSGIGEV